MSHYIHASYPSGESELSTGGYNLNACSRTGFDFYAAYNASQYDAFWSGAGGVVTVSYREARRAFLHALAWAFALLEYCRKLKDTNAEPDAGPPLVDQVPPVSNESEFIEWAKGVAELHMEERRLAGRPLTARPPASESNLPDHAIEDQIKEAESAIPAEVTEQDQRSARKLSARVWKLLESEPPDADDLDRSASSVRKYVEFTWEVYQGTKIGPATMAFG